MVYNVDNVNSGLNYMTNSIKMIYDKNFPLTRCSRKSIKNKPWVSNELKAEIKIKNKLYQTSKQTMSNIDIDNYKKFRNNLRQKLEDHRQNYFKDQLNNRLNSIKNIWKILNAICSWKKALQKVM